MSKLNSKPVKYINRDFGSLRDDLIAFSKTYFPDLVQDFNESSPGMMFLEMSAYVGDVLSYYTDVQFKESLLFEAEERKNVLELAQALGYQPKVAVPSQAKLSVYQLVPAIGTGTENRPDYRYALIINPGMRVGSSLSSGTTFNTIEFVDFTYSSSLSPTNVTVYDTLLTTVTDTLIINTTITGLNPPSNQNILKVFQITLAISFCLNVSKN
jgi:hypothetical protein